MIELREACLRSNARFRLVPFDRLSAHQLQAPGSLSDDPDFFGVLLPAEDSALPIKSVSREAALLFMALREAARLPHLLKSLFGNDASERVRQLILDSVLEVELDGRFVSGPSALTLLGERTNAEPATRLARLSRDAISYAAALEQVPVQELAGRLYLFNATPCTRSWHERLDDEGKFNAFLFEGNGVQERLASNWRRQTVGDSWLAWRSDEVAHRLPYKLYVSPSPEQLPAVFALVTRALAKTRCRYFKLGRGTFGVLRPDKVVAYFGGLEELHQATELIQAAVTGVAAQGVPFTAPIDTQGLLSWGMDPPRFEQVPAEQQHQSWRQWLTSRIAVYVAAARESGADVPSFVRNRIALDGVDPVSWNPDLAIWRGPVGTEQERF